MSAARSLSATVHVRRVPVRVRAIRPGCRPRPVIRVVQPATLRILQLWDVRKRVQSLPFRRWIATIHRLHPIESSIPHGNIIAMEVRDSSVCIRIHSVVRGVSLQFHGATEIVVVPRLRAKVRLHQCLDRLLHQPHGHPFAVCFAHDRAMMRPIDGDLSFAKSTICCTKRNRNDGCGNKPLFVAILIKELVTALCYRL
jgi:hypothetical protein